MEFYHRLWGQGSSWVPFEGEDRLLGNLGNMGNKFSTDYGLLLLDAFPSLKLQERRLHLEELSSVLWSTSVLEEVRFSAQHSSL